MNKLKQSADEKAFVEQLSRHQNEWVAIQREKGKSTVVASGKRFKDARESATAKGFPKASLMKVPSSKTTLIATFF